MILVSFGYGSPLANPLKLTEENQGSGYFFGQWGTLPEFLVRADRTVASCVVLKAYAGTSRDRVGRWAGVGGRLADGMIRPERQTAHGVMYHTVTLLICNVPLCRGNIAAGLGRRGGWGEFQHLVQ